MLVGIDRRAIEMAVAEPAGIEDRFGDGLAADRIGTKRAQTDGGHRCPGGKLA